MTNLVGKTCVPCKGDMPPMEHEKIQEYLKEIEGWQVRDNKLIFKTFTLQSFNESINFVNQIASLAEQEKHHPDIIIRYKKVTFELTTHAIKGLSENDFIMASKIDLLHNWERKVEKTLITKIISVKVLTAVVVILLGILILTRIL